ncbi:MAG: hypothetical protein JNM25_03800 [Planctomycetes bacterium]|nr:hypothetical protein [Planctomycetota bacterium]
MPTRPVALLCALLPRLVATAVAQAPATPTFTEHVAPIVFGSCAHCHRPGEVAPFPLLSYADVKKRGRNLLAVVEDRFMPPWHPAPGYGSFRGEARLTDAQIDTLRAWVEAGMPEGPADRLPPLPAFPPGWQLGEPDLVLQTQGAFVVPADGRDIYRNFAIPLGLPDDVWVTAIEVRPQARGVLHHVLIFLDEERQAQALEGRDGRPGFAGMRLQRAPMLAGWAVGGMPEHLPDGLALRIPKGSDLVLQSHLHPSGKRESEQTTIGLHLARRPPPHTLVSIQLPPFFGFTKGLDIPAGEPDYRFADSFELPCDVLAITVGGHAHKLCRSMRMHAVLPDGADVPLLHIPHWDFDWQNRYTYREPVRLPKGAVVHAELRYDNSAANPDNPNDPPERVRWGRETTDEMGSITLLVVPADDADLDTLQAAVGRKNVELARARVEGAVEKRFHEFDTNGDGVLTRDEAPRNLRQYFDRLDRNGDGQLSPSEAKALAELLDGLGREPGAGSRPGRRLPR